MNTCTSSGWRTRSATILAVLGVLIVFGASGAGATPAGSITEFTNGLTPGVYPDGIAAGPDGNLWFTEGNPGQAIARITPSGTIAEFSNGLNAHSVVAGITEGPDGNMWFTDNDNGVNPAIGKITPNGTITEFSSGLNAGSLPIAIAAGPDGNLWFADRGTTPAIGRITPSGTITEFSNGLPTGPIDSSSPVGITAGPDGNVWFTDDGNPGAVGKITPSGTITEYPFPFAGPNEITQGPDGNLWFVNLASGNRGIGRATTSGSVTVFTSGLNPNPEPWGIAAGPDGNVWFTDEGGTAAVGEITPSGTITEYSTGLPVSSDPNLMAAGPDGNVWFTEEGTGVQAIGRVVTGAPPGATAAPAVTGTGQPGDPQSCAGAAWSTWNGSQPSLAAYGFDGYTWLLDGTPIAGQTTQTYTPAGADLGHQLSCAVTATYPLFPVTVRSASAAVTVGGTGGSGGSGGSTGSTTTTTTTITAGTAGTVGTTGSTSSVTSDVLFCVPAAQGKHASPKCTGTLSKGAVLVRSGGPYRVASLSRKNVVYATGLGWRMAHRTKLVLQLVHSLTPGTYTLHLAYNHDKAVTVR